MIGLLAGFLIDSAMQRQLPEPPPMPRRAIAARELLPGTSIEVEDGDVKYTLFLPEAAKPGKEIDLTIHFHSAVWHALQEHVDRGADGPVIAFYPGEGSSVYQKCFTSPERLQRWISRTLDDLKSRGWPKDARIAHLDLTSFSAGYGAVRELVKQPEAFKLLRRVILADSMYGSLSPQAEQGVRPKPLAEHVEVWKALVETAIRGEKTFVVTFSEVPTEAYASSSEMAGALVEAFGAELSSVVPDSIAATKDPEFPLKRRFDKGNFHVWGYGGQDGQAHMTHARHLADIWKELDRVGAP